MTATDYDVINNFRDQGYAIRDMKDIQKLEDIFEAVKKYPELAKYTENTKGRKNKLGGFTQPKTSIKYVWSMCRRLEKHKHPAKLPEGQYDIILANPPYDTMNIEDIKNLKIPAADDAVLYLWCDPEKILDGLAIMEAWGFKYRTGAVWLTN